jgi:hypothetical protein
MKEDAANYADPSDRAYGGRRVQPLSFARVIVSAKKMDQEKSTRLDNTTR